MKRSIQYNLKGETPLEATIKHIKALKPIKDKIVVGISFGNDSIVLGDLYVQILGCDTCFIHSDTHVQFKESKQYGKKMVEGYWGLENYHETKPIEHFRQITDRIGLHGIAHNKMICCSGLKNKPLSKWMHQNDKTIAVTGLRRSEGKRNCDYQISSYSGYHDIRYYNPMLFWSEEDVTKYYEDTGLPLNPLYKEPFNLDRTGCAPCPNALKLANYPVEGYKTYYDLLADKFPKWYKYAWGCQRRFYKRKCGDGDQRGYGEYLYRHKWKWPLD